MIISLKNSNIIKKPTYTDNVLSVFTFKYDYRSIHSDIKAHKTSSFAKRKFAKLYTELYLKWARGAVAPPQLNYEPHARAYII